ncbi:MAG: NAD(P) transhydrogenase subunit alpha [Victivallaceae bacterium]|nr:NAD(P) transhydrogenase subunit alpha [Victivallaceae bacterium]
MSSLQIILLGVFIISTLVGYFLINNVPSLLHTPLMSGMNALSGITLLGALVAAAVAFKGESTWLSGIFGATAIITATVNIIGGFAVTDRMLKMFARKGDKHE